MEAIKRMAAIARPHLEGMNCVTVDLGCGTGLFEEVVGNRSIIGVDFSPSMLALARTRMDTVWQKDIFRIQLPANGVDNVISLFVIDDYPSKDKLLFFREVFSFLKQGGRLFFAAYSPRDERMGSLRELISSRTGVSFKVYLEEPSFYTGGLGECGFTIDNLEAIQAKGLYRTRTGEETTEVKREFILIVARKADPCTRHCTRGQLRPVMGASGHGPRGTPPMRAGLGRSASPMASLLRWARQSASDRSSHTQGSRPRDGPTRIIMSTASTSERERAASASNGAPSVPSRRRGTTRSSAVGTSTSQGSM